MAAARVARNILASSLRRPSGLLVPKKFPALTKSLASQAPQQVLTPGVITQSTTLSNGLTVSILYFAMLEGAGESDDGWAD